MPLLPICFDFRHFRYAMILFSILIRLRRRYAHAAAASRHFTPRR